MALVGTAGIVEIEPGQKHIALRSVQQSAQYHNKWQCHGLFSFGDGLRSTYPRPTEMIGGQALRANRGNECRP